MKLFINSIVVLLSLCIGIAYACDDKKINEVKSEIELQKQIALRHEAEIKAIEAANRLEEVRKKYPEAASLVNERLKKNQ